MTELILKSESKVISANAEAWAAQQKEYLAGLPDELKDDKDLDAAKEDLKEITAREESAKIALDMFVNQNPDIKKLVEIVEPMIEELRQARISHSKLIAAEKERHKAEIAEKPIAELKKQYAAKSPISQAFSVCMPLQQQIDRINEATKNKRTIDSLTASVNTEFANIRAEMMSVVTRLNERLDLLPKDKMYLFSDAQRLIAGVDDLPVIVEQRVNEENERIARQESEAKLKAEAEVKAEVELKAEVKQEELPKQEAKEAVIPRSESGLSPKQIEEPIIDEPKETYKLTIEGIEFIATGYSIEQITGIAKKIKGHVDTIRLDKIKG